MAKIPQSEVTWIGANLNGHVGEVDGGASEVVGMFGVGERNEAGSRIVGFATAIVKTLLKKKITRHATYISGGVYPRQILFYVEEMIMVKECKVLRKVVTKQHKLAVCKIEVQISGEASAAENEENMLVEAERGGTLGEVRRESERGIKRT